MATPYNSQLRYLDADDIDDSAIDFDGLDVRGADGHKLGDLDGFIVDSTSGRVYHAVVDSGGWFTSRRFLLPIGHARLDADRRALTVDVTKDRIRQYPEFDADRFRKFTDDEMRAFEQRMSVVCCPDDAQSVDAVVQYDTLRHYSQPDWWKRDYNRADRFRDVARVADRDIPGRRTAAETSAAARERERARETYDREHAMAHDRSRNGGEVSPQVDGRAQPGDVLGIRTGGEQSHLGEDAEDENKRRRDAERNAAKPNRE
jgi:PRC-barrel domain